MSISKLQQAFINDHKAATGDSVRAAQAIYHGWFYADVVPTTSGDLIVGHYEDAKGNKLPRLHLDLDCAKAERDEAIAELGEHESFLAIVHWRTNDDLRIAEIEFFDGADYHPDNWVPADYGQVTTMGEALGDY